MENNQTDQRTQTVCLLILTGVAIALSLYWLAPVMIPFVLALFFSLILSPLIDIQIRVLRFPRLLALVTTLILGFCLLITVGLIISASVNQLTASADSYQSQIQGLVGKISSSPFLEKFGLNINSLLSPLLDNAGKIVGGMAMTTVNAIINLLSKGILVLIFLLFLLIGKSSKSTDVGPAFREGENRIKKYIATKIVISSVTGILVAIILLILNVDLALVFGLFAFLLNFIPSVGSLIATLLPLPVVLVSPDLSTAGAIMAIAIPGAVQFAIGNVIEPKIMGDSLDLHPAVILMALIFWGMIWGIVGMLLAVPLTVILKIILEKIEVTKPYSGLFAGRLDAFRH